MSADDAFSEVMRTITVALVFLGCWIYCMAAYGFLLGVGLGWLPSAIVAAIAAALWPLVWLAVLLLALLILKGAG